MSRRDSSSRPPCSMRGVRSPAATGAARATAWSMGCRMECVINSAQAVGAMDPDDDARSPPCRRAAPGERGWTDERGHPVRRRLGCPARGGGPCKGRLAPPLGLAAPRERGWTPSGSTADPRPAVCPARAWTNPTTKTPKSRCPRRPARATMDHARAYRPSGAPDCPARAGWIPWRPLQRPLRRGCPARAGMDPGFRTWNLAPVRLPCTSENRPSSGRPKPRPRPA